MKRIIAIALVGALALGEDPSAPVEVTQASAASVKKGLDWLVSIQGHNGSWG